MELLLQSLGGERGSGRMELLLQLQAAAGPPPRPAATRAPLPPASRCSPVAVQLHPTLSTPVSFTRFDVGGTQPLKKLAQGNRRRVGPSAPLQRRRLLLQ